MKKLLVLLSLIIGCGGSSTNTTVHKPEPTPIPTEQPEQPKEDVKERTERTDLPVGWYEVKGDGWSFGLPDKFERVKTEEKLEYTFSDKSVMINFGFEKLKPGTTIDDYASSSAISIQMSGGKILSAKVNDKGERKIILIVSKVGAAMVAQFIMIANETGYVLSFGGLPADMKANSKTCFEIVETLKFN